MSDHYTNAANDLLGLVRRTTATGQLMQNSNVLAVEFGNSAAAPVISGSSHEHALSF